LISTIDKSENYLVNLYTTVDTANVCSGNISRPECYYNLSELSFYSADGTKLDGNRLGSTEYITPFQDNAPDKFGDIPISFYFQNSNNISGGFSFILPKKFIDKNKKVSLEVKYNNELVSKISISL
jgi:hypothetical protein